MAGQPPELLANRPAVGSITNDPNCVPLNTNEIKRPFSDAGAHFDSKTLTAGNMKP